MAWDGDRQKDYIQVDQRIQEFYAKFPDGRLQSEIVTWQVDGRGEITTRSGKQDVLIGHVVIKGLAFRTPDDPLPGIGFSSMLMPGGTPYTRNSEIENAETSAWGRAIAACGIEVRKGIASADEIRNKESDGERYEVRITPSNAEQPQKGGHQDKITRPQIVEIIELSKSLDYDPTEMADIICGLVGRPVMELPEEEAAQKKAVKELMASLTADEGGKVIQTLMATQEALLTPAEREEGEEAVEKAAEEAISLGLGAEDQYGG